MPDVRSVLASATQQLGERLDALARDDLDQRFLRFEVVVERPAPDVGGVGDVGHGQPVDALLGDERACGVRELGARAFTPALQTGPPC